MEYVNDLLYNRDYVVRNMFHLHQQILPINGAIHLYLVAYTDMADYKLVIPRLKISRYENYCRSILFEY